MMLSDFAQQQAAQRGYNLLLQETRETLERARLGGLFYPIGTGLSFLVTSPEFRSAALAITLAFAAMAALRLTVRVPPQPDIAQIRRALATIWSIVLLTVFGWSAFSVWGFLYLPEPAPLIALLFTGAFGMAMCSTLGMRRTPAAIAIFTLMLPLAVLLWSAPHAGPGVAAMWLVYMVYMLLVLLRSYREYRVRLELEEDLRQQRDLFEKQARIDGLTGIANRREFDDALLAAVARAREGGQVSLLILDIDHFKLINDRHGHQIGDACLVAVAQRLQTHFSRPGEIVARLGGEEFAILTGDDAESALARAEQIRRVIGDTPLQLDGCEVPLTLSIGCAAFAIGRFPDAKAFYREVDAALYAAKIAGRNRVMRVDAMVH